MNTYAAFIIRMQEWEGQNPLLLWILGLQGVNTVDIPTSLFPNSLVEFWKAVDPMGPVLLVPLREDQFHFRGSHVCTNAERLIRKGHAPEGMPCVAAVRVPQRPNNPGLKRALLDLQSMWDEWWRGYQTGNGMVPPWGSVPDLQWYSRILEATGKHGLLGSLRARLE